MSTTGDPPSTREQRQWFIAERWQEYAGEARANLLRLLAIGAFYIVQLVHFHWFADGTDAERLFHQRATAVAVAWTLVALAVMVLLRVRMFSGAIKYVSTTCDVLLLTALASLGRGPESPLVLGFFLIVAAAGLRFRLGLVWFTTALCMFGYLALVGQADRRWFDAEHAVAPVTLLWTLVSLAFTGIVIGQVLRSVHGMAAQYAGGLRAKGAGAA